MGFDGTAFIDRFNTVWNGHDVDGILAMMTDDVVFSEAASPVDQVGKKAVERSYKEMFKAFSDVKLEITRSWAAGDYLVYGHSLPDNAGHMLALTCK